MTSSPFSYNEEIKKKIYTGGFIIDGDIKESLSIPHAGLNITFWSQLCRWEYSLWD